ncbi:MULTISPECIES: Rpn family recombination-promoting nuclease/putative transposase [unclassified Nodularia (in: cyanobacteria)]|uniref:Rpn family recombination-promoting nuclease/putative transposase n=1 Tax=unclassified Nodularia (in: cyanobacteria) TaxID=2656917 RepID=UPI001882CF90|nr:Rpn family recombination-promoting nuclease/putative transposase [Nodularia sp. LEGE 06071]MBE9200793.1 Rpn family recombination-promoting nuclease/putative transposase [Nodularia sp. LEGE 06071]MCC2693825.1 Rpn family recombination-promoting nuclease/putative transposase [Nodularia sp. LEGE 04288]
MSEVRADYDGAWKEGVEQYFEAFLAFFFPEIQAEIDWTRGYEFLDKELQQLMRESEVGKQVVDKLIKVWLNDGKETWLLVHLEIQSQVDPNFAQRMFSYHYRIFDRYNQEVVSLAILGDNQPSWRPQEYSYGRWGCRLSLQFPIVKLLDYEARWLELEQSESPFAVLVMAHLRTQATTQDLTGRLRWKLSLIKRMYELGYSRDKISQLFRLLDRLMTLPPDLDLNFKTELKRFEAEKEMRYITSIERIGIAEGIQQSIAKILKLRFQDVPPELVEQLNKLYDIESLNQLLEKAVTTASIAEFQQELNQDGVE